MSDKKTMEIDVTKIMAEIRGDIEKRGLRDEVLPFDEIPMPEQANTVDAGIGPYNRDEFMDSNMYMNRCFQVQTWHPLQASGILAFLVIFFKKVIRKLIRFFIDPIVSEQNEFNANTTRAMNQVRNYIQENNGKVIETKDEIQKVRMRVDAVSREMEEMARLRMQVDELSRKVEELAEENRKLRGDA